MIIFKKGSIVPRRLGAVVAHNKKAQHWIVFGVDVQFDGKSITPVQPMRQHDNLILVIPMLSAPRKNGTRQKCGVSMGRHWVLTFNRNDSTHEYSASLVRS